MPLNSEQLAALKAVPLGTMPNKVRLARALLESVKAADVAKATGMTSPQISDIERGQYKDLPLEKSRELAKFFGCAIEDLFPAREAVAS
jgi:transcriptional regulator with XRE-family HTH domain